MYRLTRHVALDIALEYAERGVREEGGNNRGPIVQMFQRADTLPGEVYAWCQSTMNAFWRLATGGKVVEGDILGGTMLAGGTASVGFFLAEAKKQGWLVDRPFRGDHFCMHLDGNTYWPDHVGQIVRVLELGATYYRCLTVEGNTGSTSVDDGDGLYVKERILWKRTTEFVRVPGMTQVDNRDELRERTGYWAWLAWYLGEGDWREWGPRDPLARPNVPKNITLYRPLWWVRMADFLAARK